MLSLAKTPTPADIDTLLRDQTPESERLDYKAGISLDSDGEKQELAKDVCALANSGGGHLIVGIAEERDVGTRAMRGIWLCGAELDHERVQHVVRDRLDPPLMVLPIHKISCEAGVVHVIAVPDSWNAPHRVKGDRTGSHFFRRLGTNNQQMRVAEIGDAFNAARGSEAAAAEFVRARHGLLATRAFPVTPRNAVRTWTCVHIVPLMSFRERAFVDFRNYSLEHRIQPPSRHIRSMDVIAPIQTYNADGLLITDQFCQGYLHLLRNGCVEAAILEPPDDRDENPRATPTYYVPIVEQLVFGVLPEMSYILAEIGIAGTCSIHVSLGGLLDKRLQYRDGVSPTKVARDPLILPHVSVETSELVAPHARLRMPMDALWQAGGFKTSPSYTAEGEYKAPRDR